MLIHFFFLLLGFVIVVLGAEGVVQASASLAKRLKVTELVIGLTIVAFGTSAPEFIVNIIASFQKEEGIVIGNILGSNIFNLLLILGIGAVVRPLKVKRRTVILEIPYAVLTVLLIGFAANDKLLDQMPQNLITRSDALQMLAFFIIFLMYTFWLFKEKNEINLKVKDLSGWTILTFLLLGFLGLFVGGKWVVHEAVILAKQLGVTQELIALTIVSAGTSLPELATSIVAALRGRPNIAMGNILGSNIFNSLFILPISAIVQDIPYPARINADLLVLFAGSLLLVLLMGYKQQNQLSRVNGGVLLLLYGGYLAFVIWRG
ncbi:MAG: sodium:calcium antiporter [Calditrichaeota bacterium]|nr:MAG: sodium:calcium antiporter [Calditrichota bacterium]